MSTIAYAFLQQEKTQVKGKKNDKKSAPESPEASESLSQKFVVALAALVPAEVLLVHETVLRATTTTTGSGESSTTVIDQPQTLLVVTIGLFVLSMFVYLVPNFKTWTTGDLARMLFPAIAFALWLFAQTTSAINILLPELTEATKISVVGFGSIVVALLYRAIPSKDEAMANPSTMKKKSPVNEKEFG